MNLSLTSMKLSKTVYKFLFKNQTTAFWAFLIMLILPNVAMFFTESQSVLTRLCSIALPFSIYWLVMTFPSKPGKAFWWLFIFIFFDAFETVLLFLYGESPIAVDMFLNLTTTNVNEVDELLENLLTAIGVVVLVYMSGIVMSIFSLHNKEKLSALFRINQRKYAFILLIITLVTTISNYFASPGFRIRNDIFPANVCYNLALAVDRSIKTVNYGKTSAAFKYDAKATHPDSISEIYVLVIGETARADNFGIYGYTRNTTPLLSKQRGLVVCKDAITMSNTTHKSVPMLMSSIGTEPFDSIYYRKGIITAFKEAGFKTVFISNQRRNNSFIDFFGKEAHKVFFLKDNIPMTSNQYDNVLTDELKKQLKEYHGGKMLVVLHCYGSHFNYSDRYPADAAVFKPYSIPNAMAKYRDDLINSYDNTIKYTDYIVSSVIGLVNNTGAASTVIYTSDHGEDIFDDCRERFLHASPLPTYYQIRVPLIVWTSPQYSALYPTKIQQLRAHSKTPVSTNMVVFHTLLDMAGISTHMLQTEYAMSSNQFKWHKRLYVNDHNEFRNLDDAGLKRLDVEAFKRHGLQYP